MDKMKFKNTILRKTKTKSVTATQDEKMEQALRSVRAEITLLRAKKAYLEKALGENNHLRVG